MKHPMWLLESPSWNKYRAGVLSSPNAECYTLVGYVITWFAAVEIRLTFQLYFLTGGGNKYKFHTLTKGMDSRVKLERFRQLAADGGHTIGPNLKARLAWFEEAEIPFRNALAHGYLRPSDGNDELQIGSIAALPATGKTKSSGSKSERVSHDVLLAHATWLGRFANDLQTFGGPALPKVLEIANPHSQVPKDIPLYRDGKVDLSNGRRRAPKPKK